jgi:DNA polymerase-3 subunit gamma/tau
MRDAQSIFDQVVAFAGTDIKYSQMIEALNLVDAALFFNISESGKAGNIDSMFQISKEILTKGYDLQDVFGGLLEHYRNLLTVNVIGNTELIKESESNLAKYKTHATDFTKPELLRVLNILSNAEQAIRFASQPKIKFELTLVQIASLDSITEISELINLLKNENTAARPAAKQSTNIARESVTSYEIKKPTPKPAQFQAINITDTETEKPGANLKPADPESGWKDFLAEYSAKEGLALLKSLQVIFSDSEVIVYTEAEFTYNNLQNKKALIMDRMEEFFGRKIRFKVVLDADKQQELSNNSPNKFNKESETFTSQTITEEEKAQLHPTDRIIIEKFGAKRLKR